MYMYIIIIIMLPLISPGFMKLTNSGTVLSSGEDATNWKKSSTCARHSLARLSGRSGRQPAERDSNNKN